MPHDTALAEQRFRVPARTPLDSGLTVRYTDWSGGFDHSVAQDIFRQLEIDPAYYEGQNIDCFSEPSTARLCPAWNRIGTADTLDYEFLFYAFNNALYRFPTANFDATKIAKITSATGTPSWSAIAGYPGTTAIRNAVVWRNQTVIAEGGQGANALRTLSTADAWGVIAAAAPAPTTSAAGQVGIAQDDRLLCWFESQGLFAYDGSAWTKVFPPATNPGVATDKYCDLIVRGIGSTIFVTRDDAGTSTVWEWIVEPAGQAIHAWLREPGLRFWPQGGDTYADAVWLVARLGQHENRGVLWFKEKGQPPEEVQVIFSNGATAGQDTLDWALRSLLSVGDVMYVGGSSRQDHNACLYWMELDSDGALLHPTSVISAVAGPLYSIGMLPYGATGTTTSDRVHASAFQGTFYKDEFDNEAVTADATVGFLQLPDFDLGIPDNDKIAHFIEVVMRERSLNAQGVEVQYRLDPSDPTDGWTLLGFINPSPERFTHLDFPHDDTSTGKYGKRCRVLQVRLVFNVPTTGTARDVVDSVATAFARVLPLAKDAL